MTLTGALPDVPDAATGLVHLGGGRWYDPALGRPLQPNPMGGPPTVPQALNRYAATPLGQPGVYEAARGIHPLFQSTLNQVPGLVLGKIAQDLSSNLASRTVYRMGFTGYGILQAEGAAKHIAALGDEWTVTSTRLANGFFRKSWSFFARQSRIQTAQGRVFVGKNLQYLDEYAEGLGLNGVRASLLKREVGNVVDDAATHAAHRLGARLGGRAFQSVLGGAASGLVQLAYDYDNPYLSTGDKGLRFGVSFTFGASSAYLGAAIGGPVGMVVGFVIGTALDYAATPYVFENFGLTPERNIFPLTP